jgi:hypothetical protein
VHGPGRVRARVAYADLERNRDFRTVQLSLRTSKGRTYDVGWTAHLDRPRGDHFMVQRRNWEDDLRCPGLSHEVDYGKNVLSLEVPRACLQRPRWVAVKVIAAAIAPRDEEVFGDVVGRDRWARAAWSKRVHRD